jgi:hypothetical protein
MEAANHLIDSRSLGGILLGHVLDKRDQGIKTIEGLGCEKLSEEHGELG